VAEGVNGGGTMASAEYEANGGLGAEHPAGSMGRAPGQGGEANVAGKFSPFSQI